MSRAGGSSSALRARLLREEFEDRDTAAGAVMAWCSEEVPGPHS